MSNSIISIIRTLKENPSNSLDNSSKMKIKSNKEKENINYNNIKIENEKNKNCGIKKRLSYKVSTTLKRKSSSKISIDGNPDTKKHSSNSNNKRQSFSNNINKLKIISKVKEQKINPFNTFQLSSGIHQQKQNKNQYNNIKSKSKYIQNLLNDMSIKKYKQICIDIIKHDNIVKKIYENAGFEKNNFSYENFVNNKFFNEPFFNYKLEMLFLDENNFIKKNFKENFFKNEITKYLKKQVNEEIYTKQMNNLKNIFQNEFNIISNFDLFHD